MIKLLKVCVLAICLVLGAGNLFAHVKTTKATVKKPVELGSFDNQTYNNRYFNIKFTLPENWMVQEKAVNQFIKDAGKSSLKAKKASVQKP